MKFSNDNEFLQFAAAFLKSKEWGWMEEVAKARVKSIMGELNNPRTTADGRAMLTGRLLEADYFIGFVENSYKWFQGQKEAAKAEEADAEMTTGEKEAIIRKTAFPEIVTH